MSSLLPNLPGYEAYLQQGPRYLTKSTVKSYRSVMSYVLKQATEDELRDPQMLNYIRTGLPDSYAPSFPSVWATFKSFAKTLDLELPDVPSVSRIRFTHPMNPDAKKFLAKYWGGVPTLTWVEFLTSETDPTIQQAAFRIYSFLTGSTIVGDKQPIFAKTEFSLEPTASWVIESIAASNRTRTKNLPEQIHATLNEQLSDTYAPASISAEIYKCFVAGYVVIRRRTQASFEEAFVEWEQAVKAKDYAFLLHSVRSYCGIKSSADVAGILFR